MTLGPQDPQTERDVIGPETDPSPSHPASADDANDVNGQAPSASGAYIYGYDSAGNPTLTEAIG